MKLSFSIPQGRRGFTLPEILISIGIFLFIVAGVIAANFYGMRMFQNNQPRLNVSAWSRNTLGKMSEEIHACSGVSVGYLTNGQVLGFLDGETQQGVGLLIYPFANNTNNYIVYYINPADNTFRRATDKTNSAVILIYSVTNLIVFDAENYSGGVLTNNLSNKVIHMKLEVNQPGSFMKDQSYYKLETSIKQRVVP